MTTCDDARTARALGRPTDADLERHLAGCPACTAETPALAALAGALACYAVPPPAVGLAARVAIAASPLLAANARRARRRGLVRALAAGLLPLPLIVAVDFFLVRLLGELLGAFLPRAVTIYLVADYAVLLALLLGLTYAAIPVVAARQLAFPARRSDAG